MRYTRKYAESWFRRLATGLNKDVAEDENFFKFGAWIFDYNALYGGAIIEEVINSGRGVTTPLTRYRLKPFEFGVMCQAVLNAIK